MQIPFLHSPQTLRRVKKIRKTLSPSPQARPGRFRTITTVTDFPHKPTGSVNILFKYMYRDASNYKQYGQAIFSNDTFLPLDEVEQQIRACLDEGKHFIARQVHLEERFFDTLYDDDHPWHEFEGIHETTLAAFDPHNRAGASHRDITEFIAEMENACQAGWDKMCVRTDMVQLLEGQKDESGRGAAQRPERA